MLQRCWTSWVRYRNCVLIDCVGGGVATQSSVEQRFSKGALLLALTFFWKKIIMEEMARNPQTTENCVFPHRSFSTLSSVPFP